MNLIKENTAAFVGNGIEEFKKAHPKDTNLQNVISTELFLIVKELCLLDGFTTFICKREPGFPKMAADAVTEFQNFHPDVRLEYIEPGQEDLLLANSSALIALDDVPDEFCGKVPDDDMSIYSLSEYLPEYLADNSEAKQFFQKYSHIENIRFCASGILVSGADKEPFIISFQEMKTFMLEENTIKLELYNGMKLLIPLQGTDCKMMFP